VPPATSRRDVWFDTRHIDPNWVEVIPTPGHTPGSTCFLVPGVDGETYLFTGDTVFVTGEGHWRAGNLAFSDTDALIESLELLSTLNPDLVVSSAFGKAGATAVHGAGWAREALASIKREPITR
jgi:glyoxylase-like metal-dependent hydrolase (beta-lactamase superfamily II)